MRKRTLIVVPGSSVMPEAPFQRALSPVRGWKRGRRRVSSGVRPVKRWWMATPRTRGDSHGSRPSHFVWRRPPVQISFLDRRQLPAIVWTLPAMVRRFKCVMTVLPSVWWWCMAWSIPRVEMASFHRRSILGVWKVCSRWRYEMTTRAIFSLFVRTKRSRDYRLDWVWMSGCWIMMWVRIASRVWGWTTRFHVCGMIEVRITAIHRPTPLEASWRRAFVASTCYFHIVFAHCNLFCAVSQGRTKIGKSFGAQL